MGSQRDFLVKVAYSLKQEGTYGTALADNDISKSILFLGPDMVERVPSFDDNQDEYGKGHPYPTEQYMMAWDVKQKRKFKCSVEALGFLASLALGSVNSVQPNAGTNPTVYNHTMVPFDGATTQQLPSTTICQEANAYEKKKFAGMCVADLSLSGEGNKWVDLEGSFVGSGKLAAFAASMPTLLTPNFLRTHSAKLEYGPYGGALTEYTSDLKKWSFQWDNDPDMDDSMHPGSGYQDNTNLNSGAIRGRLERGTPKIKLSLTKRVQSYQEKTDLENCNSIQVRLTLVGEVITGGQPEKYQAILDFYKLRFDAVPIGMDKGQQVYNIDTFMLYDSSVSKIFQLQVQNKDVAYLVP